MMDPDCEVRELLEHRPRSHGSGSFPREYLPRGEAVLFETRPALGIYFLGGIAIVFVSTLLGLLLFYGAPSLGASASAPGVTSLLQALGLIAIVLGILGLAALVLRWYSTSYVVTNRRVVRKFGFFSRIIVDARFDKIQAVTLTQAGGSRVGGFGHLLFSLSTFPAPISPFSGIQHGGVLWFAVPDPLEVRAFMEDVFDTFSRIDRSGARVALEED